MAPKKALYLSLLYLALGGCACVATKQDWEYKLMQRHRAGEAWRCCFTPEQRKCLSCHYESGFKAGYYETSIGRDCRVPPVAPSKYWSAHYQSCEGQEAVQDWFRGYQDGINAALGDGYYNFNEVPVSAEAPVVNKTACGKCRSCEPCECEFGPYEHSNALPWSASSDPVGDSYSVREIVPPRSAVSDSMRTAPSQDLENPQIGLIGGFGAAERVMVGPFDPAVLNN